jgi:hypothetical protein
VTGHHALVAAPADASEAASLAGLLADRFLVQPARDEQAVAAFLAARAATDVVLVHADGVRVDPAALAACPSPRVLVLPADLRLADEAPPGRTVIAGASTRAVVRALRDGRADDDLDGEVTARELHDRLARTHPVRARGDLDAPFVVARTDRAPRLRRRARGGALSRRAVTLAGVIALVASLPMAWFFGEPGLVYALGDGTAWPARVPPLLCLLTALAGLGAAVTGRGDRAIPVLAVASCGALLAIMGRFLDHETGPGVFSAAIGLTLLLYGSRAAGDADADGLGVACVGAGLLAYQVAGPRGWSWIALACVVLAANTAWAARRRLRA